jgi:hypothetical protein
MRTVETQLDDQILRRIYAEYCEMPGLRLTLAQAERLFGIPRPVCATLLDTMVARELLRLRPDGTYAARHDGMPMARATLRDTAAARRLGRTA